MNKNKTCPNPLCIRQLDHEGDCEEGWKAGEGIKTKRQRAMDLASRVLVHATVEFERQRREGYGWHNDSIDPRWGKV
jgi:hypothetical protein